MRWEDDFRKDGTGQGPKPYNDDGIVIFDLLRKSQMEWKVLNLLNDAIM